MAACDQELCPNWTGNGRVCGCALLGLEPGDAARELACQHGEVVGDDE